MSDGYVLVFSLLGGLCVLYFIYILVRPNPARMPAEGDSTAPPAETFTFQKTPIDARRSYAIAPRAAAIRAAIRGTWDITITYEDERGEVTTRKVTPSSIQDRGRMVLYGYCHLRQEDRHFRLDRIRDLEVHAARQATCDKYRCAA